MRPLGFIRSLFGGALIAAVVMAGGQSSVSAHPSHHHHPRSQGDPSGPQPVTEGQELLESGLVLEESAFEANGPPIGLVNARARVKNIGAEGLRDATVRFFCRPDGSSPWTLVGQRPLPNLAPGSVGVCDLVADSSDLPIFDPEGNVKPCLYLVEIYQSEHLLVREEGQFHPACLHDSDSDHHLHQD